MSLVVKNISKKYGKKVVLDKISVIFEPQKIYGLLGRNGAGKSTLLNIINNRTFATSGEVFLDDEKLTGSEKQLNRIYLMSEANLYPAHMSIKEIFKMSEAIYGDFDWALASRLLTEFELTETAKFQALSTGYRTVTKIIVSLCVPCEYIFFDEPVLGLDAVHRDLFYETLVESYATNPRTFIISTHLIEEIANMLENIVLIDHGRIFLADSVENVLAKSRAISGPKELVDKFINKEFVLNKENLGNATTAYVTNADFSCEIPKELAISSIDLQTYFIQFIKGKGGVAK